MASDGRITEINVVKTQKRYIPERHYVFILKIKRENLNFHTAVFRTFQEFCELESKMATLYPHSQVHR